jgi:hypothetical protein
MDTIAVISRSISGRKDLEGLIIELSKKYHVKVYNNSQKSFLEHNTIEERSAPKLSNLRVKIITLLYMCFGVLPENKENYFVLKLFEINNRSPWSQIFKSKLIKIRQYLPSFIKYDTYLSMLEKHTNIKLNDIDKVLIVTEAGSSELIAAALKNNIPSYVYVYSWDHPFKHTSFSKRYEKYFVWGEGVKKELIDLHLIPESKIQVTGATQFSNIKKFLSYDRAPFAFNNGNYFFYGCGVGYRALVVQEVKLIHDISKLLLRILPNYLLVVRKYPLINSSITEYDVLLECQNVIFDNEIHYLEKENDIHQDFNKYLCISNSKGFIHCGTTLGFEACYLKAPSIFVCYENTLKNNNFLDLKGFMNQQQNVKYLKKETAPNFVHNLKYLSEVLIDCAINDGKKYMVYNQMVSRNVLLNDIETISSNMVNSFEE